MKLKIQLQAAPRAFSDYWMKKGVGFITIFIVTGESTKIYPKEGLLGREITIFTDINQDFRYKEDSDYYNKAGIRKYYQPVNGEEVKTLMNSMKSLQEENKKATEKEEIKQIEDKYNQDFKKLLGLISLKK
jgi:hypothetical protein